MANARFQAAAAIRDAAIREWGFLSTDEKRSMIRLSQTPETYRLLFLTAILVIPFHNYHSLLTLKKDKTVRLVHSRRSFLNTSIVLL